MDVACCTFNRLPDRLTLVDVTRCDKLGEEADGKVVSFPLGRMGGWERTGAVLMRFVTGSCERTVPMVFLMNCWRVMR
jgi:hypothetical protein